jgi:two-component system cell cycle sensor histidine kinase/response regulator CckA
MSGTETILIAEDDETLRNLTQLVLESHGYKVILSVDGQDAVDKFVENEDSVDLLIFDMIMPKMSGLDAYRAIIARKPGVKAVFLSGYTADKIRTEGLIPDEIELVSKPITQNELLSITRNTLSKSHKKPA